MVDKGRLTRAREREREEGGRGGQERGRGRGFIYTGPCGTDATIARPSGPDARSRQPMQLSGDSLPIEARHGRPRRARALPAPLLDSIRCSSIQLSILASQGFDDAALMQLIQPVAAGGGRWRLECGAWLRHRSPPDAGPVRPPPAPAPEQPLTRRLRVSHTAKTQALPQLPCPLPTFCVLACSSLTASAQDSVLSAGGARI